MASIEKSVRLMLINGTTLSAAGVADASVTHGYRLQDSALPAVTYTVDTREDASVAGDIQMSTISVTSIAATSEDAVAIAAAVRAALVSGTYDTINIDAVIVTADGLQPEVVGFSDEQEPSQAVTQATIYWRL
jgi:hypothetical protein